MEGAAAMALEQLHLENFTVFRKLDLKFCRGINVLIGENGTGKTHLLKVLYAFYESNTLSRNAKLLFFDAFARTGLMLCSTGWGNH